MRSFQQIIVALFALFMCAFAQSTQQPDGYDATVYVTSTVYRVNTVTLASSPTGAVANQTSTIIASHPSAAYPTYASSNGTAVAPTGSNPSATDGTPSPPSFTGAASALNANAYVAALAAAVGYLVL